MLKAYANFIIWYTFKKDYMYNQLIYIYYRMVKNPNGIYMRSLETF